MSKHHLLLAAWLLLNPSAIPSASACTTPLVGRDATADASTILAQAKTAREGLRLLGRIVERQGAGEGFGAAFGDRHGVWYFKTASGHHWLARKRPLHAYFVSANQGRLQEVNLNSTRTALASPGLRRFAAQHQLWQPRTEAFNFLRSFVADTPPTTIHGLSDRLIAEAKRRLDGVSARIISDLGIPTPAHDDIIRLLKEAEKTYHYGGA